MISNLQDSDKQTFGSTLDNLVLLMMTRLDENKLQLRNRIEKVLGKLIAANIIREENNNYYFYNEDEVELSKLIASTTVGSDFYSETLKTILFTWLKVDSKIRYAGNDFRIVAKVDGKNYQGNSGDITVSFTVFDDTNLNEKAFGNQQDILIFCINEWFLKDKDLREEFQRYCKVELYTRNNQSYPTEARKKSIDNFKSRNKEIIEGKIKPTIYEKFAKTSFVSGNTVIEPNEINGNGAERYRNVIFRHLESVYKYAKLAETLPQTQEELKQKVSHKVQPNDYTLNPLSEPEKMINDYITRQANEILLADLLDKFKSVPYGWKDVSIIYIVSELYKRKLRDLNYRNQPHYPLTDFVNKALISSERSSLSIVPVQAISQDLINQAIGGWKTIFNEHIAPTGDGNAPFEELRNKRLSEKHDKWIDTRQAVETYPFAKHLTELIDKLAKWKNIREPQRFFETLHAEASSVAQIVDICQNLKDFAEQSLDEYNKIKRFVELREVDFQRLEKEDKDKAALLNHFMRCDNPVSDFRQYRKIKLELEQSITEKIKELKAATLTRYEAIFKELDTLAEVNDVTKFVFADSDYKLGKIAKLNTISDLTIESFKADNFLENARAKILLEKNEVDLEKIRRKQQTILDTGEKPNGPAITMMPPISYSLPKASHILSTEAEVDAYIKEISSV
ncbi:hypothetical protein EZS27_022562 [termite gut metagenome]|uniref:Uncharacterized protein n=1 Tax=termite gut metagenome TaxID=433724 RepID=A0A5J4R602_9ZZZZ